MNLSRILDLIESVSQNRVLFVGDTIIDEYQYVRPLGKSPKENLIPVHGESKEIFRGGVDAAANHAREFCRLVDVMSCGLIVKKVRMIDQNYFRKLFEVHYNGERLEERWGSFDYDGIIVTDFGHGAIDRQMVDKLCREAPFLAVSVQTNSANIGFNLVTKYPNADYAVIDEPEARLAAADRESRLEDVIFKLAHGHFKKLIVTHGKFETIGWSEGEGFVKMESFTDKPLDTMGAGDAFFAVTAPMAKNACLEDLIAIGNAAGAMKTQIIGHRRAIRKKELIGYLKEHA